MIDLEFRAASPQDAEPVVDLMYESSKGLLDYSFGFGSEDPRPFLRRDFVRGSGLFGYRHQVVGATTGGAVVTTMTVYPGRNINRLNSKTALTALRHFGPVRFAVVMWRLQAVSQLFIKPRTDALFFANLCVVDSYRGKGIASALFEHVWRTTRDLGLPVTELDVSFPNLRAQQLYERLGFNVIAERPYRGDKALDGFRRMQKRLIQT